MIGSVFEVVVDVSFLLMGPVVASGGVSTWRRPDEPPQVVSGGPAWVVRCWSAGIVLLGITVTALGGFDLAGREEARLVGVVRTVGAVLVVVPMVVAAVFRYRKRRGGPHGT